SGSRIDGADVIAPSGCDLFEQEQPFPVPRTRCPSLPDATLDDLVEFFDEVSLAVVSRGDHVFVGATGQLVDCVRILYSLDDLVDVREVLFEREVVIPGLDGSGVVPREHDHRAPHRGCFEEARRQRLDLRGPRKARKNLALDLLVRGGWAIP